MIIVDKIRKYGIMVLEKRKKHEIKIPKNVKNYLIIFPIKDEFYREKVKNIKRVTFLFFTKI